MNSLSVLFALVFGSISNCETLRIDPPSIECVTASELEAAKRLMLRAVNEELQTPEFSATLETSSDWQDALTFFLLSYERPRSLPEPELERVDQRLATLSQANPSNLSLRLLLLARCEKSTAKTTPFLDPNRCRLRQAEALRAYHPDNAWSYLVSADAAWGQEDQNQAVAFMTQAAQARRIDVGFLRAVRAVYQAINPLTLDGVNDPLQRRDIALYERAVSLVDAQIDPLIRRLARRCQAATVEPLLSGCLHVVQALKLPGTLRLSYSLALGIETSIHKKLGNAGELKTLTEERLRSSEWLQRSPGDSVMHQTGQVLNVLNQWVEHGEAFAVFEGYSESGRSEPGNPLEALSAMADSEECIALSFGEQAPPCVTDAMLNAELTRVENHLHDLLGSPTTLERWRNDPEPNVQVVLAQSLMVMRAQEAGKNGPLKDTETFSQLKALVAALPDNAFARRVLLDRCMRLKDWRCTEQLALAWAEAEPDNAIPFLTMAAVSLHSEDVGSARLWLNNAASARRSDRGFGLLAKSYFDVYHTMLPGPASDPLRQRNTAILGMALGWAGGMVSHDNLLRDFCLESDLDEVFETCLSAARAMQLPGHDFMGGLMGVILETQMLEASGDEPGLALAIEKRTVFEQSMVPLDFHQLHQSDVALRFVNVMGRHGQVEAFRQLNQRALPELTSTSP
ncbi:MAG: hypothetical protein AB8B96_01855 [Lysobacterales bacterium]